MKLTHLVAAITCALSFSAQALTYTQVALPTLNTNIETWSNGITYDPYFPGAQTLGGIPFVLQQDRQGDKAFASGILTMDVNIADASTVYTLISTGWGLEGATVGSISFRSNGGSWYTVNLVEGDNVRDHYYGDFVNTTTASYVTQSVLGTNTEDTAHLDMQAFALPAIFHAEGLDRIVFVGFGNENHAPLNPNALDLRGVPFLAGVTVAAVPEPNGILMFLGGLGMLGVMIRRRTDA